MIARPMAALSLLALAMAPGGAAWAADCAGGYTVRPGDTLEAIARSCDVSVDALLQANPQITDPAQISVGLELTVPGAAAADNESEEQPESGASTENARRYTVEAGDSMARIASRLGVPLPDLLAVNQDVDPRALQPGQELMLPVNAQPSVSGGDGEAADANREQPGAGGAAVDAGRYTVEPGDSMAGIASRLGLPLPDLLAANRNVDPHTLRPGQELILPSPAQATDGEEAPGASGNDAGAGEPTGGNPRSDSIATPRPPEEIASPEPERLVLEGRVQKGSECPILRTPDGLVYSLVSQTYGFTPGDYVAIEGEPVEMAFCIEGQTVRVTSMRPKPAPQGG